MMGYCPQEFCLRLMAAGHFDILLVGSNTNKVVSL